MARQISDAGRTVDAFCLAAEDDAPAAGEPGDLAVIEDILAGLEGAVGSVNVQQGPVFGNGEVGGVASVAGGNTAVGLGPLVTDKVSVATPSSTSSASTATSSEGRARGMCGSHHCLEGGNGGMS